MPQYITDEGIPLSTDKMTLVIATVYDAPSGPKALSLYRTPFTDRWFLIIEEMSNSPTNLYTCTQTPLSIASLLCLATATPIDPYPELIEFHPAAALEFLIHHRRPDPS